MADVLKGNVVIGQSGGPTAVINQSLAGLVSALKDVRGIGKIYGMRHGVTGLGRGEVVDLGRVRAPLLRAVAATPSAALGSSREKPDRESCARVLERCRELGASYFFYIGGNDSSDTCRIVAELAESSGRELRCFHVPKTVDNDLMGSDHTPGFPSAARFVATAFMGDNLDNASLPGIKINVVMGRHAGFLTAASALARRHDDDGPHLIYLPEVPFDTDRFIADVASVHARLGRCQIAVSEGIVGADGRAITTTLLPSGEVDPHGNVQLSGTGALGDALAQLVKGKVRPGGKAPRVRADTFGYLQRCWPDPSPVDAREARGVGAFAARLARSGKRSGSVAIRRVSDRPYKVAFARLELAEVAAKTRHMPAEFIAGHNDVTPAFIRYCRPLVGKLPEMARLERPRSTPRPPSR
ncbi:MAG TPA: 6-phosphofructokinase [Phycisphaerales bacterium]|nr:6-phosphofructokinase [Phycisphaerales bacterium]